MDGIADGTVQVAAIDDDPMVRVGFAGWLAGRTDLNVTCVAATVDAFIDDPRAAATQVVLLDLNLRDGVDPAANIGRLRAAGHQVLIMSVNSDAALVLAAIGSGAAGYLIKNDDQEALAAAAHTVAAGHSFISPELAFVFSQDNAPHRPRLTKTERAVVTMYANGATLKATARQLGISPSTAQTHLERVKAKYHQVNRSTHTKTDLAARLREDGERLDPPPGHRLEDPRTRSEP